MAQKRDGGNVTKEVSKMSEKAPLLRIENIGKDYFGNCVLQDVTFSLKEGRSWDWSEKTAPVSRR